MLSNQPILYKNKTFAARQGIYKISSSSYCWKSPYLSVNCLLRYKQNQPGFDPCLRREAFFLSGHFQGLIHVNASLEPTFAGWNLQMLFYEEKYIRFVTLYLLSSTMNSFPKGIYANKQKINNITGDGFFSGAVLL